MSKKNSTTSSTPTSKEVTGHHRENEERRETGPKDVGSDKFDKKPSVARVTFGNMTALNRLSSHGGTFQIKSVRKVRCFFLGVGGWNWEKIVDSWFQGCASHEFKTGRTGANEVIRPICYGSTQLMAHILKYPPKHKCSCPSSSSFLFCSR